MSVDVVHTQDPVFKQKDILATVKSIPSSIWGCCFVVTCHVHLIIIAAVSSKARQVHDWASLQEFYPMANTDTLTYLYTTLVRPHLEYACPVWAPYTHKDTDLLESIQRFACKMATCCWSSSYEELLASTDLPTLERRGLHLKLSHLFKIVHQQSFFPNGIVSLREHS